MKVSDEDGATLGEYYADLLVEDCLVGELKACKALVDEQLGRILGYLRACRMAHGLLINFGAPRLEIRTFKLQIGALRALHLIESIVPLVAACLSA